jgi:hypothetical protein
MHSAITAFRENIQRVKSLGGLFQALSSLTTSAIDATDLLRAQIVLTLSALDCYIHEVTRIGMLEIFDGVRQPTPAYLRFRVSSDCIRGGGNTLVRSVFDSEIRSQHAFLSFQHPDKIAEALRLISELELWKVVGKSLSAKPQAVKQQLKLCVDRRNKIAHEADLDPTYPKARWPVSVSDVAIVVEFINDLTEAIHARLT